MSDPSFILSLYPPDCRPTRIEPLHNAGGMSGAQFWRVLAPRGTLILRRWPREHPAPERLRFLHAVLLHAVQRDITFLPVPIRATSSETFIEHAGHMWELSPWMPGTADYEKTASAEKLRAAMQALARFHIATGDFQPARCAPSPAIERRLKMLQELQSGGLGELSHAVNDTVWTDLAPLAGKFLAALPTAIPRAIAQLALLKDVPFSLQPCLRDIWHDHVLFSGNDVTGIIDFGAMNVDTPACDIARLLGSLVGDDAPGWQAGISAYSAVRSLMTDESRAIGALDASGTLLAGCNWIRWIYVERRQFENHTQVSERFCRIVDRLCQPQNGGRNQPWA
jgi:Ser/Thr protein kinase RdoA (MazF antagonist)